MLKEQPFLDFSLKSDTEMLKLPFAVSKEFLENPIFSYNLIEDLMFSRKNHKTFKTIKPAFPYSLLEEAEIVLAIMQKIKDLIYQKKSKFKKIFHSNILIKVETTSNSIRKLNLLFFEPLHPKQVTLQKFRNVMTQSLKV